MARAAMSCQAADAAARRKIAFGHLAVWASSTLPPLREELLQAQQSFDVTFGHETKS